MPILSKFRDLGGNWLILANKRGSKKHLNATVGALKAGVHNVQILPVKGVKMKSKNLLVMVIGLAVVSLILGACSASGKSGFLAGKYLEPGNDQAGLQFNEDGTWLAFNGPYTQAKGTYSVKGDTYTEESNNVGCPSPMSFKFKFDGTHLTFNYIGNPADDYTCDGRRAGFDNVTYTLSN